jgi:hypothetical protein
MTISVVQWPPGVPTLVVVDEDKLEQRENGRVPGP